MMLIISTTFGDCCHTELLVGIPAVVVLGCLDSCAVTLNGNLGLSSAGFVIVVDNITRGSVVLVGAHVHYVEYVF